jgi:hypothetical protein
MYQQSYYVPKRSGTLSDSLLAYGLAVLLQQLLMAGSKARRLISVRIEDAGSHYLIILPEPVQEGWLEERKLPKDMALAIKRKKNLSEDVPQLDFNKTWEGIRALSALKATQRNVHDSMGQQATQDLVESFQEQSHRDLILLIGDYRMQVEGIHNQAIIQWHETTQAGYQVANLKAILQMFATPWSDVDEALNAWVKTVRLKGIKRRLNVSQVYNPSRGKGLIRTDADKLHSNNHESFWLLEYLKAVGLFVAAAPRAFTEEKMRKTYVLAPYNISITDHEDIFKQRFEPIFYGLNASPIKADILASLQYAKAYLSYCLEARSAGGEAPDLNPRNSIKGFYVATYVLLNDKSYTMLNLSFLGLPPWLHRIDTLEDVVAVQMVIEEHERLIRSLAEQFQEGSDLLYAYRDFLTGNQLDAFFDFCANYGEYVVHTLLTSSRVKQYSATSLDEIFGRILIMEQDKTLSDQEIRSKDDLTEFGFASKQHPGFHRIAYAIRQSTVIPQRQSANYKSKQRAEKPLYTVRYGLGQNLRRKANSARELLEALTEFVHEYNAETDQVYENTSQERMRDPHNYARTHYRQRVMQENLDDVLALVKEYGPRLVCNMLVAYGYSAVGGKDNEATRMDENDLQNFEGGSINNEKEEIHQ